MRSHGGHFDCSLSGRAKQSGGFQTRRGAFYSESFCELKTAQAVRQFRRDRLTG